MYTSTDLNINLPVDSLVGNLNIFIGNSKFML